MRRLYGAASRLKRLLGVTTKGINVTARRSIGKWLNEELTCEIDRVALAELCHEYDQMQTRLDAMKQCFIDNTLRTTPSAKGTNIGKQIDEAVDRVVRNMNLAPNAKVTGRPLDAARESDELGASDER